MKFQRYFKGVSRKFQGCSNKVFRMLQGRLEVVSLEIEVGSKNVQKKLNACYWILQVERRCRW